MTEQVISARETELIDAGNDLALVVIRQAEQIAAVLTLHYLRPAEPGTRYFGECNCCAGFAWPCPTACALGVTP